MNADLSSQYHEGNHKGGQLRWAESAEKLWQVLRDAHNKLCYKITEYYKTTQLSVLLALSVLSQYSTTSVFLWCLPHQRLRADVDVHTHKAHALLHHSI